ncbi:MAG: type VI secretion system tip protein VgrG [Flavisolibacter sp.]
MLDDLLPQTQEPTDVLSQKILVDGTAISNEIGVFAITVGKQFNRISSAKIILLDGDSSAQKFELSNEDLFTPGSEIEIQLGYHSNTETVFKGIITKHALKAKQKTSYLYVEAKDKSVALSLRRKNSYFFDQKDSEVIEDLAGNAGLDTDIESTSVTYKEMVQFNCTDWDFILSRAEMNSMLVLTDDGKLIAKKPSITTSILTATYGSNIFEFETEMDARRQFKSVKTHSWNFSDQKLQDSEDGSFSLSETGNISAADLADIFNSDEYAVNHAAFIADEELKEWADAYAMKSILSKVCGKVKLQGVSSVKPGDVITLDGISDRFNGKVFVTGVQHIFSDKDYQTEIQFGWNHEWFYKSEDIVEKPASGLVPGINGLHTGIVTKLESDPDNEFRVKVKVPLISNDEEGIWCRIALLDAGNERGSFFMPEINDEVVLGFVNDDPRHGIILGMLHSQSMPAPVTASDDNNEKGFYTRSKMKLVFDDDKKSITIITPKEKSIVISDDDGSIILSDELNNKITMNKDGITIESDKDIKLTAKANITAEATQNIDLKATSGLKAKGTSTSDFGDSTCVTSLKGSMVNIN